MGANLPLNPTGLILPGKSIRMPQRRLAVTRGLVNYWPLSNDAVNLTSATVDDLMTDRGFPIPITSVTGANLVDTVTGGGIAFDGSSNLALANQAALSQAENSAPFSMTCWVRMTTLVPTQLLLAVGTIGGGSSVYLGYRPEISTGVLAFSADGSTSFASADASPVVGQFYFIAGVAYANVTGGIVLFVNGVTQLAKSSNWGGGGTANDTTTIASSTSGGAKSPATLFECRIYNRALDAGEVMELYKTGLAGRRDQMFGLSQWDAPTLSSSITPTVTPTRTLMGVGV